MDLDRLASVDGLGSALVPLVGGSAAPSAPTGARNPAEVLAALMDFPGSVALAELLESAPAAPAPEAPGALQAGSELLHNTQLQLDSLEVVALKPLLGRRAPELPSAAELLEVFTQQGFAANRSAERALRVAEALGAPFRSALGLSLRKAQAHVATLRWELTHPVRALGRRAEELERLDAAVTRSMQAKVGELLDRMEHAAHQTFVRACLHAMEALPDVLDESTFALWCARDGWLARYRERCVRIAKALFGHLRRGLEGLIHAAIVSEEP